jgi:hypothetical protein
MPTRYFHEARLKLDGKSGGSYIGTPWRLVIHTTETRGMPSYNSGLYAPHITYYPRFRTFTQHTSFLTAARALRNKSGGVQTNRNNTLQMEMICYSDSSKVSGTGLSVADLTPDQLDDIERFIDFVHTDFGIQKIWPGRQAFSSYQSNKAGFRFTNSAWDEYNGVCGHQHVPENTHWDPGALCWECILDGVLQPAPDEPEEEETMKQGDGGEGVKRMQQALIAWDPAALPVWKDDGDFGPETTEWVKKFQVAFGLQDTGIIYGVTAALLATFLSQAPLAVDWDKIRLTVLE